MTVFKGSQARLEAIPSANASIINSRNSLVEQKVIKKEEDVYIFQEDYTFNSPSSAATVILASNVNGWNAWKNSNGESLDEIFRKK
jgi:predicted type IV restriction endonuclease